MAGTIRLGEAPLSVIIESPDVFSIIDGQHRFEAAKAFNAMLADDDPMLIVEMTCNVYPILSTFETQLLMNVLDETNNSYKAFGDVELVRFWNKIPYFYFSGRRNCLLEGSGASSEFECESKLCQQKPFDCEILPSRKFFF
jgi:hypothetical protein